jgi:hypothetical protein
MNKHISGPEFFRWSVTVFLVALLLFWILAIGGLYVRSLVFHHPFTIKVLFLNNLQYPFNDFTPYSAKTRRFLPVSGFPPVVYPAPMMCGYVLFGLFEPHSLIVYELSIASALALAAGWLAWRLARNVPDEIGRVTGIAVMTALLCFPFWYEFERGNMEGIVWIVQALAVAALIGNRNLTGGLLIALGASMKFYPGVLFLILLSRRRYKDLAISVLAIVPIQLTALMVIGPSIPEAYRQVKSGLGVVAVTHIFNLLDPDVGFDHSLFGVIKQILYWASRYGHFERKQIPHTLLSLGTPYSIAVTVGFLLLYWFRVRKLPALNQLIVLMLLATMLPPIALEYTLVQVTIPWAVFLLYITHDGVRGTATIPVLASIAIMIAFAFVFAPAPYLAGPVTCYAGQFKLLALACIVGLLCWYPLSNSLVAEVLHSGPITGGDSAYSGGREVQARRSGLHCHPHTTITAGAALSPPPARSQANLHPPAG